MKFIHPTAEISPEANIGGETKIWHHVQIREGANIGNNCNIGKGVYIDSGVKIGNNCKIQNYVSIYKGVFIEDDVFIGPAVTFTNDLYPRSFLWDDTRIVKTKIKKGASIGANSTIICGVTVGEYAMVGGGSVVTKDVPNYVLVYGNPARNKSFICKCGRKLENFTEDVNFIKGKCSFCEEEIFILKDLPQKTNN